MRCDKSSPKKIALTVEAPIWKSYLAVRSYSPRTQANNAAENGNQNTYNQSLRAQKRMRSLLCRGKKQELKNGIWMTLGTQLKTQSVGREDADEVLTGIRNYWNGLSVNERQQILFLDDPELVTQLYKLNLSLLCVGLLQRHLRKSNRTATITANVSEKEVGTKMTVKASTIPTVVTADTMHLSSPPMCATTATSEEKAYELLEAMEFMDIGTGILTVKTDLVETTDYFFTLGENVLTGFLTSIHVLKDSEFTKLFVKESEMINSWANYQRLIAMLLEQLILRSYVLYLENEAVHKMEELLLIVSFENKSNDNGGNASSCRKKKNKKKKKKKKKILTASASTTHHRYNTEAVECCSNSILLGDINDKAMEEESITKAVSEVRAEGVYQSNVPTAFTENGIESIYQVMPVDVEPVLKKLSSLNPNALAFQPQGYVSEVKDVKCGRSPLACKQMFETHRVSVSWEDVESDAGSASDSETFDGDTLDIEKEVDGISFQRPWRRKLCRREEDAKLEWQLQQVYLSTSSLFGWDFTRQCKLSDSSMKVPWSERNLWRTAPEEVVRFFSYTNGDPYAKFHASQYLPTTAGISPSRYYYNPDQSMPFNPPLLPRLPSPHGNDFQSSGLSTVVVSSPHFRYGHLRKHESQADI